MTFELKVTWTLFPFPERNVKDQSRTHPTFPSVCSRAEEKQLAVWWAMLELHPTRWNSHYSRRDYKFRASPYHTVVSGECWARMSWGTSLPRSHSSVTTWACPQAALSLTLWHLTCEVMELHLKELLSTRKAARVQTVSFHVTSHFSALLSRARQRMNKFRGRWQSKL